MCICTVVHAKLHLQSCAQYGPKFMVITSANSGGQASLHVKNRFAITHVKTKTSEYDKHKKLSKFDTVPL